MRKSFLTTAVTVGAFVLGISAAYADKLIPIVPIPNAVETLVNDINSGNTIVGDYLDSSYQLHAFFGSLDGKYTFFDFPDGNSIASGLSDDGYIVGNSYSPGGECPVTGCDYLRSPDGTIQPITKHGKMLDGDPGKMISRQRFVGDYYVVNKDNDVFEYGYYGKGTKYKAVLVLPFNTDQTTADGYNVQGTVVGYFHDLDNGGDYPGFVLQDGIATAVRYPDSAAFYTYLTGVNRKGIVAGFWCNQAQSSCQAFLFDSAADAFEPISVTGASNTLAYAINDAGLVVLDADGKFYIDCTKKKNCPSKASAIDISTKWFAAPLASLRSRSCHNGCLSNTRPASVRPMSAAALREAIKNDPLRRMQMQLPMRR